MTENFEEMTVAELKELLKERGLPVSGKKAELIERLSAQSVQEEPVEEEVEETAEEEITEEVVEEDDDEDIDAIDDEDDFDDDDDFFEDWDEEDEIHIARQKPELDEATNAALKLRKEQADSMPSFRRQEWFRYKRLSRTGWRRPKGLQSKLRLNKKYRGSRVRIGHRKVASVRGLHSSGFKEVLVHGPDELEELDPKTQAVRIGATVGNRRRLKIHSRADDLGLRILNRRDITPRGDLR